MARYSEKAQPYLDVIAAAIFSYQGFRDWLLEKTPYEASYMGSLPLIDEQRDLRWRRGTTKQPFWANYHCGRDRACECRIAGSVALESDAIFYLRNKSGRTLAVHVEFKHKGEPLSFGQSEGYALRAECFQRRLLYIHRYSLSHDDWTTIIICDENFLTDPQVANFERAISHSNIAVMLNSLGTLLWPVRGLKSNDI